MRLDVMARTYKNNHLFRGLLQSEDGVISRILDVNNRSITFQTTFGLNEELIDELKEKYTIAIVTHSMQQAARVSQRTAYFHLGKLIEVGDTKEVFTMPRHELTENYITGRFG